MFKEAEDVRTSRRRRRLGRSTVGVSWVAPGDLGGTFWGGQLADWHTPQSQTLQAERGADGGRKTHGTLDGRDLMGI